MSRRLSVLSLILGCWLLIFCHLASTSPIENSEENDGDVENSQEQEEGDETDEDDDDDENEEIEQTSKTKTDQNDDDDDEEIEEPTSKTGRNEAPPTSDRRKTTITTTKRKIKKEIVPVYVPMKERKKFKIISVDEGFYIAGGNQMQGKFKSLKQCMKACAALSSCFSADYNPWLHKCYAHTNLTACNKYYSHPQFVHFSKVPCAVTDAPSGNVALGVSVQNGVEQKGINSLQQCIKKCANAGGGIQATVSGASTYQQTYPCTFGQGSPGVVPPICPPVPAGVPIPPPRTPGTSQPPTQVISYGQFTNNLISAFGSQACFAIDYDFTTHKCFFFGSNVIVTIQNYSNSSTSTSFSTSATPEFFFLHCPARLSSVPGANTPTSLNAIPNPTTVHITLCPTPTAPTTTTTTTTTTTGNPFYG